MINPTNKKAVKQLRKAIPNATAWSVQCADWLYSGKGESRVFWASAHHPSADGGCLGANGATPEKAINELVNRWTAAGLEVK